MSQALHAHENRGIIAILLAAVFNAASGIGIYYAHQTDAHFSPFAGIFLRIVASFSCLIPAFVAGRELPKLKSLKAGRDLWLWGFFGVLTLSTYYFSVTFIGAGKATMFNAGSGVFIAVLAPLLAQQKAAKSHLMATIGCIVGMILLSTAHSQGSSEWNGILLAIASGLFSALAYAMVARTGRSHSPETVLFHWSITNLLVISTLLILTTCAWPSNPQTWIILIFTAFFMAWAQYLTAIAYQNAQASLVACLSFLGPLLNVFVDFFWFKVPFSKFSIIGAAIIVLCGLVIPLTTRTPRNGLTRLLKESPNRL